jgi:hypothetical protein
MSDRELLELAAKAAGVGGKVRAIQKPYSHDYEIGIGKYRWNPLTDDGDALRLAVKIGNRDYFGIEIQKGCTQATSFEPWEHCEYEEHNSDPYAATRRAIVKAAAEIGKEMQ